MIDTFIMLGLILMLVTPSGIVYGVVKKNKQITKISIIVFVALALTVILLEVFFFE